MPDHYCPDCDEVTQDCRCGQDICPDCGDAIQQDSEKVACSCTVWEVLPQPMTTATARLNLALITLAVRGERPRCADPITHAMWTSDDQHDRAIAVQWPKAEPA